MKTLAAVATLVAMSMGLAAQPPGQATPPVAGIRAPSVERLRDLALTESEEATIAGIREEYAPRVEEAIQQLAAVVKDECDAARAILTPEQRVKLELMREVRKDWRADGVADRLARLKDLDLTDTERAELQDIRKEFRPKIVKELENLKRILTPEQALLREQLLRAGKPRREVITALNLTDDQKVKVEAIAVQIRTLIHDEINRMRDVLTPEQQEKVAALREQNRERARDRMILAMLAYDDLKLTDDQKARIQTVREEYRPRVEQAGDNLRAIIREELAAIVEVLKA